PALPNSTLPAHFPKGKASSTRRITSSSKKSLGLALDKTDEQGVEDDDIMEDLEEEGGEEDEDSNGDINTHAPTDGYPSAHFLFPQPSGHFLPPEYFAQMSNYPHSYLPPPQPHSNLSYPYPLQSLSSPYQFQSTPQQLQPTPYTTASIKKERPRMDNNTNRGNGNSQIHSSATPLANKKKGKANLHNKHIHSNNTSNNPNNTSNNNTSSNNNIANNNFSNNNTSKNNKVAHDPYKIHHDPIPENVAIVYHDPSYYDPNTSNGLIKKKIAKVVPPVPTIADTFKSIASSPALGARPVPPDVVSIMASASPTCVDPGTISQPPSVSVTASASNVPVLAVGHLPIPTTGQPSTAVSQPTSFSGNGGTQFYTLNDGTFFSVGGDLPSQYEDKSGNTVLSCRHHWGFKGHRLCQGTDAQDYNCLICLNKAPLGNVKPWNARCLSWKINAPDPLPAFDCCPFIRAVRRQRCILSIFPTGTIPAAFLAVWQEWCKSKSASYATTSFQPALASDNSTHSEYSSSSRPSKALHNGEGSSIKRPHVVEESSNDEGAVSWEATDNEQQLEHMLPLSLKKPTLSQRYQ
ncbi:MAG: hypothetical protein JOS17DRAFT_831824, partial [Linnemannia elongata]